MNAVVLTNSLMSAQQQNQTIIETYQKQSRRLFAFIRNKVNDDEVAQDIVQDVFYDLTENLRLAKDIDRISAWIFTVARNKIADLFRRKKTDRLEDVIPSTQFEDEQLSFLDTLKSDGILPGDLLDNKMLMEEIMQALDELPAEQREVFVMNELEEKSFKEIAALKNVPLNTLLSRKRYAVLHLREHLNDLYYELF